MDRASCHINRMQPPIIEVAGLTKSFNGVTAVAGIDFTVSAGETVALLGANGAGKTTTLSMLLGLVLPSAGSVRVLGEDPWSRRRRAPRPRFCGTATCRGPGQATPGSDLQTCRCADRAAETR